MPFEPLAVDLNNLLEVIVEQVQYAAQSQQIKLLNNLTQQLKATGTTIISVGHRSSLLQYHEYVLKLDGDSNWQLMPTREYNSAEEVC